MSDLSGLGRFHQELKRRRVINVAAAYAVVAWVLVEAADVIFPALFFPDWTLRLVIIVALIGFPSTVILAWVFDITPQGLVRTSSQAAATDTPPVKTSGRLKPQAQRVPGARPACRNLSRASRAIRLRWTV